MKTLNTFLLSLMLVMGITLSAHAQDTGDVNVSAEAEDVVEDVVEDVEGSAEAEDVEPSASEEVDADVAEGSSEGSGMEPLEDAAVPEDLEEAVDLTSFLVDAFQSKEWTLFLGALLMLLVFVLRYFKLLDKLPEAAIGWVAAGVGIVAAVGVSLASGAPVGSALIGGFTTGAAASGLWELVFKHILPKAK